MIYLTITGTIDGVNLVFTLSGQPHTLEFYRNGLLQNPGGDYTLSGSTVTFFAASIPYPGDTLLAVTDFLVVVPALLSPLPYAQITLGSARASLRLQLQDPSAPNPQWSDTELNAAIVESLRTWQALTGFTRYRATFATSTNAGSTYLTITGTINGVNNTFTLSSSPHTLKLYRNGLLQNPGVDYTLSGVTITFLAGSIPFAGDTLVALGDFLTAAVPLGFYDLAASGTLTAGLFDYNVTDVQVWNSITNTLLEPTTIPYAGTDQFSQQQILDAVIQARDQFLLDTGSVITRTLLTNPAQPVSREVLPQTIIDVRRAAWFATATNLFSTLWRFDEYSASAFLNSWQNAQTLPVGFSVSVTPPITIQFLPPSSDTSATDTEILSVSTGPTLNLSGIALGVADDLSYGVKYGALETLFSADGQDRDDQRAQYCGQRYTEAVNVARLNPSVLQASFGTSVLWANSLFDEDAYNNSWQNQTPGPPQRLALAGRNLVAVIPYSDQAYLITIDLVRNMPVPVADGDFLQIGNEKLNTILNYAQHVASLKLGGAEFQATLAYYQEFLKAAVLDNNRLNASAFLRKLLDQPAQNQERLYQRLEPAPQPMDLAQTNA